MMIATYASRLDTAEGWKIADVYLEDERGPGDRAVVVALGYDPALLLDMESAQAQLILDQGLKLLIGRVAGIERDADQDTPQALAVQSCH